MIICYSVVNLDGVSYYFCLLTFSTFHKRGAIIVTYTISLFIRAHILLFFTVRIILVILYSMLAIVLWNSEMFR